MPFCTTCGASVTGAFCGKCGTPVSAASGSPPSAAPTPSAPQAPLATQAAPPINGSGVPIARKTSPLVWVLVIILGLFILGGLAVGGLAFFVAHKAREAGISTDLLRRNPAAATARILAAANPDIEIVGENDGAGTVTVRDRKTGKTMTWNLDQAKQGRLRITAEDENGKDATVEIGAGTADKLPSWVPSYPGAKGQGNFAITGNGADGAGGTFSFQTSDAGDRVLSFYQRGISDLGMKVQVNAATPQGGVITAADSDGKRSLNVVVSGSPGETTVNVTYGDKP